MSDLDLKQLRHRLGIDGEREVPVYDAANLCNVDGIGFQLAKRATTAIWAGSVSGVEIHDEMYVGANGTPRVVAVTDVVKNRTSMVYQQ